MLALDQSVTATCNLLSLSHSLSIDEGQHTLIGEYTTSKVGRSFQSTRDIIEFWKGEIKTASLEFTVAAPQDESEIAAYQLYEKLGPGSNLSPDNYREAATVADGLMDSFPKSVYVAAAIEKAIPLLSSAGRSTEAITMIEKYFALERDDGADIKKLLGTQLALAYHQQGNSRKALGLLDQYAPGETSGFRRRIETAVKNR